MKGSYIEPWSETELASYSQGCPENYPNGEQHSYSSHHFLAFGFSVIALERRTLLAKLEDGSFQQMQISHLKSIIDTGMALPCTVLHLATPHTWIFLSPPDCLKNSGSRFLVLPIPPPPPPPFLTIVSHMLLQRAAMSELLVLSSSSMLGKKRKNRKKKKKKKKSVNHMWASYFIIPEYKIFRKLFSYSETLPTVITLVTFPACYQRRKATPSSWTSHCSAFVLAQQARDLVNSRLFQQCIVLGQTWKRKVFID